MDKIVHGLDLPDDVSERNNEIVKKMLGISDEEIDDFVVEDDNNNDQ